MGFQSFAGGLYTPLLCTPLSVSHEFLEAYSLLPFKATPAQQAAFLSCNHVLDFITLKRFEVSMRALRVFVCYSTRSSTCPQDYLFLLHCSFRTQCRAIGSRQAGSHCGWVASERMGQGSPVKSGHRERWVMVHLPGESRSHHCWSKDSNRMQATHSTSTFYLVVLFVWCSETALPGSSH